jgi:hypothetical protein
VLSQMAPLFRFFLAVNSDDVDTCRKSNEVPRRLMGNRDYIGLRVGAVEAMDRAKVIFKGSPVDKSTHFILQIDFSEAGFAHDSFLSTGSDHFFATVLEKMTYYSDAVTDWNVWHFNQDLPLEASGSAGEVLISTRWLQIE